MSDEPRIEPPSEDQRERDIRALAREVYARAAAAPSWGWDAKDAFVCAEAFFKECDARDAARKGGAR
jgi:hypothetical protein